jgi:hypothetical protein
LLGASSRTTTTIPLILAFAAALVLPNPIFFHTVDEIDDDDATAASLSFSAGSIESFYIILATFFPGDVDDETIDVYIR